MDLDPEVVRQIREVGGEELLRELFQTFLDHAGPRLGALRQGLGAGDLEGIAATAHSIRSAAASLGALELSSQAELVEDLARAGKRRRITRPVTELELRFAATVGALRLRLEGGS